MAEVAVALAVTGWFVAPLISKLVLKGLSILEDSMKGKLENLQNITVPQIKQVIENAEMLGKEDGRLMVWMRELQDAAYEADNVLDEYDYELLKQQAKGKFHKAVISPLLSFESGASFRSKLEDSLENLDKIASRVSNFTNMLGGSSNASSLDDETKFVTGSVSIEPRIFGRDAEREHILDLLINPLASESDHERDVLVLPIVGVGGVGKTALTQDIFNNPKIKKHFPTRMWIQTPQNLDEIIITRRMVESVHRDAGHTTDNFGTLQQTLKEVLQEQKERFLLVLDDVWYDEKQSENVNRDRWRKLLAPLRHGVQGSKVLITCRTNLVAKTLGRNAMQPIKLEGLNEDDCFSLFNSYAFEATAAAAIAVAGASSSSSCGQQRPDENIDLHLMKIGRDIARKIVFKLHGLPLAAKVLGGMLRDNHDVKEWDKVLMIDKWDDITSVLALSYKRLPLLLRQCVAHHGLYPKGYTFSGDYLVRAWIAEGFVSAQHDEQESGKSMEEIGSYCLNALVFRSFLQQGHDGRFLFHDLMHDVADSVSRHERIRIQKGEKKDIRLTTKHLCIHVQDLDEHKESICRLKNLRTLFLLCDPKSKFTLDHGVLNSILKKSKRLRTLDLAGCRIDKLPDSIGDLKHLHFIDLSGSTVKTLPKSFHRLYHLLYLDLSMCKFDSVPKDLSELVNLRHLDADGTTLSMIPNLGRLTALQELKEFHVKNEKGHELGQLKNMANLGGTLHIVNLENISSISEAEEAKLHDKTFLEQVWLEWGDTSNFDSAAVVLDGFKPPPRITILGIKCYVGSRAPIWMHHNLLCHSFLRTLVLYNCVNLQSLPPLGQLFPHLHELELRFCVSLCYLPYLPPNLVQLKLIGCISMSLLTEEELQTTDNLQFCQVLSSMPIFGSGSVKEYLEQNPSRIVNVDKIMSWLDARNLSFNPSGSLVAKISDWIVSMKLRCMTQKRKMMMPLDDGNVQQQQLPSSLQRLMLVHTAVDGATLSGCLSRLHSLAHLVLQSCWLIISLPSREVLSNLGRLQEVQIIDCKMLISLGGVAALASLEKLTIKECPNLMTVAPSSDESSGGALLPKSLTHLIIKDCGSLDTHMGRCLIGLTRLSYLKLSKCRHMTSFPTAEELLQLTSLQSLNIHKCEQLVSVGGLHVLDSSLHILFVSECPGLITLTSAADALPPLPLPEALSSLSQLVVDNLSLLPVLLSRKGLTSLAALSLCRSSQDTACTRVQEESLQHLPSLHFLMFYECDRLPSLPCNLTSLTCLKGLGITHCPQVSSLPSLPMSLESITIEGCHPEMEQRYREGGPDCDLIKHIPDRYII